MASFTTRNGIEVEMGRGAHRVLLSGILDEVIVDYDHLSRSRRVMLRITMKDEEQLNPLSSTTSRFEVGDRIKIMQ